MAQFIYRAAAILIAALVATSAAFADDLKIIVHSTSGGHMINARLWAKTAKKYRNGNVIVQAVPGGIGIASANYLYNVAARDGSEIGSLHSTVPGFAMLGEGTVKYDLSSFNWLGSVIDGRKDPFLILSKAGSDPLISGVEGSLSINHIRFANRYLGWNLKEVSGYQDVGQLKLAFEKGEINVLYRNLNGVRTIAPEWLTDTSVMPLVQYGNGATRHSAYPNVPTLMDFAKTDADRKAIEAFEQTLVIVRGFAAPPQVPAKKVEELRSLFDSVLRDKEYLDDAEKAGIIVTPIHWTEVEKIVKQITSTPLDVANTLRF